MGELRSLKEIEPGSVVELPVELQTGADKFAVMMGMDYESGKSKKLFPHLLRGEGLQKVDPAPMKDETQFSVVEDAALTGRVKKGFVGGVVELPTMAMSYGCDPEIFVVDGTGTVIPAWMYLPTEKATQRNIKGWLAGDYTYNAGTLISSVQKGKIWQSPSSNFIPRKVPAYWDGVQAEFAPWAKNCLETLHEGTRQGLKQVLEAARVFDPTAKFTLESVVEVPAKVLVDSADEHIQFRCSQSYNIYDDPGGQVPDARQYKYRCAGGHIHFGLPGRATAPGIEHAIKALDGILGVAGVSLAQGLDNPERRKTYGRAGEFRLPKYGVEYRVLSNFWLSHPGIAMLVFELGRATMRMAESGLFRICWDAKAEETQEVINNCDVQGAKAILNRNMPILTELLGRASGRTPKMVSTAVKAVLNGIGSVVKDPRDVEKNWRLNNEGWLQYCHGEGDSWRSLSCHQ